MFGLIKKKQKKKLRWNILCVTCQTQILVSSLKHLESNFFFPPLWDVFGALLTEFYSSDSHIWEHTHSPKPWNTNYFNYLVSNHKLPRGRGSNIFIPFHGNLTPAGTHRLPESSRSCSRTRPAGNIVTILLLLNCFNGRHCEPTIRTNSLSMLHGEICSRSKFQINTFERDSVFGIRVADAQKITLFNNLH